MAKLTLTATNSVFMLAITGLYDSPQRIVGFTTDAGFAMEPADIAETSMGIDRRFSAGYVAAERSQTITLQADSPSNDLFENWSAAQDSIGEVYWASAVIRIPSIKKEYVGKDGVMKSYSPMAEVAKTLRPRVYRITWGSFVPNPV